MTRYWRIRANRQWILALLAQMMSTQVIELNGYLDKGSRDDGRKMGK